MDDVEIAEAPAAAAKRRKPKPIRIPAEPHMPELAVAELRGRLQTARCYLEYGAGGSTRMAARMNVPHVFTVESDKAFGAAVAEAVKADASAGQMVLTTPDIGRTGAWGRPASTEHCGDWPDYPLAIWDAIAAAGVSPDLVLIDGRFRVACFLASLLHARPGATILFDDYVGRQKRHGVVEAFVKPDGFADRMAIFTVPESFDVRAVGVLLARNVVNPS